MNRDDAAVDTGVHHVSGAYPAAIRAPARQEQRDDDQEDEAEDPVGLPPVAADEAFGALEQPDADRDRDPDQDAGREHVLDQPQPVGAADQRQLERRIDQLAHDLEDRGEQDQEPPEDQRVHQAGERALEELALAEDLDAFTGDPARDVAAFARPGGRAARDG